MGAGFNQWGTFFQEASYGVFANNGATLFPRFHQANAFTVRKVPQRQVIRTADAANRPIQVVANRFVYRGTLRTLLYPSQAPYWATALTLSALDLPSYSFEYWDTVQAWKLLGGKIEKFTITSNAQQDYVSLDIDWIFQSRDATFTVFAQPAQSNYPTEVPYCHVESSTNMKLGGVAITKYKNWNVTVSNILDGTWDETSTISALYWCGRDLTMNYNQQYGSTALRGDFEAQTALTFVVEWKRSTQNITFTCEASSYVTNITDDLPLDKASYQSIDVQPFFDLSATADFAVTSS